MLLLLQGTGEFVVVPITMPVRVYVPTDDYRVTVELGTLRFADVYSTDTLVDEGGNALVDEAGNTLIATSATTQMVYSVYVPATDFSVIIPETEVTQ